MLADHYKQRLVHCVQITSAKGFHESMVRDGPKKVLDALVRGISNRQQAAELEANRDEAEKIIAGALGMY